MATGWLVEADKYLFYIINKQLSWEPLDNIMLLIRNPLTWVPVYFFFLLFFFTNCRKYIVPIVLLTLLTFALTDFTSVNVIKPLAKRLRPCHDTTLDFAVNTLKECGGRFSMPSAHAANHFGLSAFWFLVISHTLRRKWYVLWLWAFAVCYAQVYIGVHFPGDVLVGCVLGISLGYSCFFIYKKWASSIDNVSMQHPSS